MLLDHFKFLALGSSITTAKGILGVTWSLVEFDPLLGDFATINLIEFVDIPNIAGCFCTSDFIEFDFPHIVLVFVVEHIEVKGPYFFL